MLVLLLPRLNWRGLLPLAVSVPEQLQSIVHLRPDTIGDLVIYSSALRALMEATPGARHTVVVRPGYEALAPLFPSGIHWVVAEFNPFKQTPAQARPELERLLEQVGAQAPDTILASTLNRTWLEVAVAARFTAARRIALGTTEVDPLFAAALRIDLGIENTAAVFDEIVPADFTQRDWESNHRFVDHVAGKSLPHVAPRIDVTTTDTRAAEAVLDAHGLTRGEWVAVFPAGLANVPIKAWPSEKFAEIVIALERQHQRKVLLLGHENERALLDAVVAAVENRGGSRPGCWLGRDGELPLLAALLASARAYVGHDTGAMHLSAAVGRPTLGIFGGGHWPRFRPIGRQVVSVVHPLPCFGCNWDCYFGDAPCVKLVEPADVMHGVDRLLAAGEAPLDEVVEADRLSTQARALIAAATPRYRALQRDRVDRQHKIEELKAESNGKDTEIAELKTAAEERKAEMEAIKAELEAECGQKDEEIRDLKNAANAKDVEILSLKRESDTKDAEITQLKREADGKDAEIAQLKRESDGKDAEIAAIKQTADEREQLIIVLDGHVKTFQNIVAEKDVHIGNLERDRTIIQSELNCVQTELAEIQARLAVAEARRDELDTILTRLPPDATLWSKALHDKDVHIGNLDTMIRQLRAQLAEAESSLANYAARRDALEAVKYYGRLLAEKESVIQSLHRACMERESLIRSLAAEAAGLGRLEKLRRAVAGFWRLKVRAPLQTKLFQKIVEQYWMQIGILQHYTARPLTWDKRMVKHLRLPLDRLPKIGLVTPSYGQATFIESTMLSVLNQRYPKLYYVVQDGGSKDASPAIIARYAERLHHWESTPDRGQADAVDKGFAHLKDVLGPNDVMAWLNSDDLLAPRTLATVADYFARHSDVDVIYGHRIIIDCEDRDVGRWIMPPHEPESLAWIDYVPQETMFWRKRAWDKAGGIDPSFQFALDWDLLARFTQAGCKIVRVPYFLGCFRVHPTQKTSAVIHTTGAEEMARIRRRFHGENQDDHATIARWANRIRFRGALAARLLALGVRW
jgi:ADP-heptose:LPS heptosyltransferase/GT2 family glycosyltransferase